MKKLVLICLLSSCMLWGCQENSGPMLQSGAWRGELEIQPGKILPINFELKESQGAYTFTLINAQERFDIETARIEGDSLIIHSSVFDSEFRLYIASNASLTGNWYNYSRGADYIIPFNAQFGQNFRFELSQTDHPAKVESMYEVTFSPNLEDEAPAVGKFVQDGTHITGTFLTETGDYRFLEGDIDGDQLQLSTFDGAHAFLFQAKVAENGHLNGTFYSGNHWTESWIAFPNQAATLTHPDSLTFLNEGYDRLAFQFPNLNGETVSLTDSRYTGKVVIVQIMGSWCPNCMDETRLYANWYKTYQQQGLEIVGLAYERVRGDLPTAIANVNRMKTRLGANYEFLIAALDNDKEAAAQTLPMLNHIISYPTSIFIDREGRVRKIHTGFNGPGTGDLYTHYVESYTTFIEKLIAEGNPDHMAQK